jgi:hypothetical protein
MLFLRPAHGNGGWMSRFEVNRWRLLAEHERVKVVKETAPGKQVRAGSAELSR